MSNPLEGYKLMAPNSRANTPILFGFAAIYLIWGSTYLALALALQTMPPFALMGTRSIAGGLLFLAYSRITGGDRGSAKSWLRASVCGILFFVGCHGILAYAEQRVPSGLAALLLATIPFWILGVRSILGRSDQPLARTMLFLLPGLGGVVLVAWRSIEGPTALQVSDILLLLAASASWALGTIIAEGHKDSASSVVLSGRELVAGGMVLLLLSAWRGEPANIDLSAISLTSLAGWCYLTLAGTVVAFGSYIWLLKRVSPTLVATYTFVNPAIAVLLGWAFLGEKLTVITVIGGLLVIASVAGLLVANHSSKREETKLWSRQRHTLPEVARR
jgi:drug/metabolite transporter (DMT)-like permease